jgi:hypothetical protein
MLEPRNGQKGAALILVIWTFAVLTALAAEFARAMREEAESTLTFKQEVVGHYLAIAGINEAMLAINTYNGKLDIADEDLEDPDSRSRSRRRRRDADLSGEEDGLDDIRTLLQGRGDWIKGTLNGERYEIRAIDEQGKIPINASAVDEVLLREILLNLGYDEVDAATVSDSIMDWRDEDDLHRTDGAEDDYYEGLERPYPCKDAPLDAIEELLLIRGVTRSMYAGDSERPGLKDIFTTAHDKARMTLNSISEDVEYALCGESLLDDEGEFRRTLDEQVEDVSTCLENTGIRGIQGARGGRPMLALATLEARVKSPTNEDRIEAHVATTVIFKNDGFQTLQWYDSIFDD